MNCPHCGQSLPDDSLFCQYCGAKLLPPEPPAPEPVPGPAPGPKPEPPAPDQVVLGFLRGSGQTPPSSAPTAPPPPPPPPGPSAPSSASCQEPWERPDLPPSSQIPIERALPQDVSPQRKKTSPRWLVICLSVLLALAIALACVFRYQAYTMESRLYDLDFLEEHIGFIVDDDTQYYHNYFCPAVRKAETYEAHNVKYCQWMKYSPCRYCW